MNKDLIARLIDDIETKLGAIRVELFQPEAAILPSGGNLQAALDAGGEINLESEGVYSDGPYYVTKPGVRLIGNHAAITGARGPALIFGHGIGQFWSSDVAFASGGIQSVVQMGYNDDRQNTLESVPRDITFTGAQIPSHRGKCGFEVNSGDTSLIDCFVHDVYDPGQADSKALWIGNSPGNFNAVGGSYQSATENIMVGGDAMEIPGVRPTNLNFTDIVLTKNLAWKGVIPVKCLFELKDGHDVTITNVRGKNCWKSAQDGYAFVLTPTRGGSLRNVQIVDCQAENVGGIFLVTGYDYRHMLSDIRSQIQIVGGRYRTNKADQGGRGIFALMTSGPERFNVTGVDCIHDGTTFIGIGDEMPIDEMLITGSSFNAGVYGINVDGHMQGDNTLGVIKNFSVEGNTIKGATPKFKTFHPNNQFI